MSVNIGNFTNFIAVNIFPWGTRKSKGNQIIHTNKFFKDKGRLSRKHVCFELKFYEKTIKLYKFIASVCIKSLSNLLSGPDCKPGTVFTQHFIFLTYQWAQ